MCFHAVDVIAVFGIAFQHIGQLLGCIGRLGEKAEIKIVDGLGASDGIGGEPRGDGFAPLPTGLGVPFAQGLPAAFQANRIERRIFAHFGNVLFTRVARQAKKLEDLRVHRRLPSRPAEPERSLLGAAHQPRPQRIRILATSEIGNGVERGDVFCTFGFCKHVSQDIACQNFTFAILHRPCARDQFGLVGEIG